MSVPAEPTPTRWDCFWFQPTAIASRIQTLDQLRWLTGAGVLIWFAGWLMDAGQWLGTPARISALTASELSPRGVSQWLLTDGSYVLVPWLGLAAALAWLFVSRWRPVSGALAFAAMLAIFHRTAWVCGPGASLLCLLLYYQLIATGSRGWRAIVGWRLTQTHVAAVLLFIGLQQFRGGVWWNGEAMGWLVSQNETSILPLKSLLSQSWLLEALTHACAMFPIVAAGAGFTVWRKPIAWLGLAYGAWMSVVTGDALFYVLLTGAYCILSSANENAAKLD